MASDSDGQALIRTGWAALPSIALFRHDRRDRGWYVLCRPGGPHHIDHRGNVGTDRGGGPAAIGWVATVVTGAVLATNLADPRWGVLLLILGALVGAIVGLIPGSLLYAIGQAVQNNRDRALGGPVSLRVEPANQRGWRLCGLAAEIAAVDAWRDRTVDPQRRVPSIVWAAVERSLVTDQRHADAQRALAHESLGDLARETLAEVERERESLDAVEENLGKVLRTARGIDTQRVADARAAERERQRRAEEQELRDRLTGGRSDAADPIVSDTQADTSAALAAEAEVVAELLAESDRMLRDAV